MKIDLRKIIEKQELSRTEVASCLFPTSKHPSVALTRMLFRRTPLDEEQLYRLSILSGLSIEQMYQEALFWKSTQSEGLVRFTSGNYSAVYSPTTGITKIYDLESLMATHVLSAPTQPLSQYLREINEIVINKKVKQ